MVSVTRVSSGRWASLDAFECQGDPLEVGQRLVSKEEALSGIGTNVGSCVCVARVPANSPEAWDYGVVTGYTWFQDRLKGELFVCFGDESTSWTFNPTEVQDLAVPSYGLRPCFPVPVVDVMPTEMRQRHSDALTHFTSSGSRATRNSSAILRRLSAPKVDESQSVPLFEVASAKVVFILIRYVVDFSYYNGSGRRVPQHVRLGETIFDEPDAVTTVRSKTDNAMETPAFLSGQLSDSDESNGDVVCVPSTPAFPATPSGKRACSASEGTEEVLRSLKQLRASNSGSASMIRSIDQVIAVRESPISLGSGSGMVSYGGTLSSKAQYQPSSLQGVIHSQLVNGMYAPMEPQLLLETLQIQHESSSVLPQAILRVFYSWDFRLRGVSIMQFSPVARGSKRVPTLNITDFSTTVSLPSATEPSGLGSVIDAVDGLDVVVETFYLPYMMELVGAARKFVVSLKSREGFTTLEVRKELVHWIDERFERVRGFLALGAKDKAQHVCAEFTFAEPSFNRDMQIITEEQLSALQSAQPQVFSTFLRKTWMQLPQFVRLLRGETACDPRSNKAFEIPPASPAWLSYQYRRQWEAIVRHAVRPNWKSSFQQQGKPAKNHASARFAINALGKQVRKGQDAWHYLVLDTELLPMLDNITCCPFGAVQKGTAPLSDDARVIQDHSYPEGASINDNTFDDEGVVVVYSGPQDLAKRILEMEKEYPGITKLMSGDVAGAFRHLAIHADHVGRIAGTIPELGLLVIDLCCPFGWTMSPKHYWTDLYASSSPKWPHQPAEGYEIRCYDLGR
ncbi:hypothetical protein PC116_g18542 [Phytophthora cactorum]|uniref:Uncharacterized protein n=1 Tax=Phytophthora cactorum TaxID=29920 RepID=A0A329RWJ5_9STRA|nr:hypothetical protein PC117_g15099 [Phytophthora cactorum]KAG3003566.1 hypothetical protein PC119_g15940 [Phytophthora cactorum]KAG4233253.1 hypothetical protein PC116_g18542 [Phytophthora cactorum]RAW28965.1 hypothetical protein PC110_g14662 [Phytophthora cactorum]